MKDFEDNLKIKDNSVKHIKFLRKLSRIKKEEYRKTRKKDMNIPIVITKNLLIKRVRDVTERKKIFKDNG